MYPYLEYEDMDYRRPIGGFGGFGRPGFGGFGRPGFGGFGRPFFGPGIGFLGGLAVGSLLAGGYGGYGYGYPYPPYPYYYPYYPYGYYY